MFVCVVLDVGLCLTSYFSIELIVRSGLAKSRKFTHGKPSKHSQLGGFPQLSDFIEAKAEAPEK